MILAFYIFSDGPLSIYQVSFDTLIYFQKYAADKLFIAKNKKESNSLILLTGLWFLHYALLADDRLSIYQV